jgi:xanthine dehydrogenase small subunit
MINFILNNQEMNTNLPFDMKVLDFLRSQQDITSTKAGCRTGRCGTCLILVGELDNNVVSYQPFNSCLLSLAELNSKHLVTVEGLNRPQLNPIQQAMVDEGAIQCGYCTPGIVIALTAFFLNSSSLNESLATVALDGNLCRCTGYQGIKRAVGRLCQQFALPDENQGLNGLIENQILPIYFAEIPERLQKFTKAKNPLTRIPPNSTLVAGGTIPWQSESSKSVIFLSQHKALSGIRIEADRCYIGATTTMEVIKNSPVLQKIFAKIEKVFNVIASTPIRHRATLGGNLVMASPVGDLSIFFLALGASVELNEGENQRTVPLKEFFKGYKQIDKQNNELITAVHFPLPTHQAYFNFERVCKHADSEIPSVSSAIQLQLNNGSIVKIHLSAGGVAPIPLYLTSTVNYLLGKKINVGVIREAGKIAQTEISPLSDVRGSMEYKRLLFRQLFYAHFITLFPEQIDSQEVLQ